LRVAFVTVGDTSRRTGGYLYNARLVQGLRARGIEVGEVVASGASLEEQERAARKPRSPLDPCAFDAVVVDALARVAVSPYLDRWRSETQLVALVHELPSVAGEADPEPESALLRADLIVTVSRHAREVLESRSVPAGRIRVVPPGFDHLPVPERESGAPRGDRVLCVAQWIPRKGVLDLIRSWKGRSGRDGVLELVGETEADLAYSERVYGAIAGDETVVVRGAVDDAALAEAYAGAGLFALPSSYEGYGIVFAEALAFGLPVVACETGPVPELVGRGTAVLVPPGDVEAFSRAFDRLIGDPDLRERMSAAARRRVATLPRWEDTVEGFVKSLREVVRL
jgi:glycosyltransferase involved in cell wall biosynthesis